MTAWAAAGRRVALAAWLVAAFAAPAAADFASGLAAYQRGDYPTALREWRPVAEGGHATAQLYLGLMYERGHGVAADPGEARHWFERAAATSTDPEEKKRAAAGRDRVARAAASAVVESTLVGKWQTSAPDPAAGGTVEMVWEIVSSGEFSMTVARKRGDGTLLGRSLEKGVFKAKGGQWSYALPTQTYEGTYRVLGPNGFETTGPLGTARWTRVGAAPASAAGGPPPWTPPGSGTGRPLVDDDFRVQRRWPEMAGQNCRSFYGDGAFIVENISATGDACFLRALPQPAAVRIELSVSLRSGPETVAYGLGFGFRDGTWASLAVTANGTYRLEGPGGGLLIPWTRESAIRPGIGTANQLAVEVQGTSITAYINGKRVGAVQASRALAGEIGFYVGRTGMSVVGFQLRVLDLGR